MIVPSGSINNTALVVPSLIVEIVPPQQLALNGVPTNVMGVVGTASWGPVNQATILSSMSDYAKAFGPIIARKYDGGTQIATAVLQGAQNFRFVRVTDGTDFAATFNAVPGCIQYNALYTGSLGNTVTVQHTTGSKAGSWKVVVGLPGFVPEVFDNITGTGNAFWANVAAAINNGNNALRPPSRIITATLSAGTTAPAPATYTLSGGTDGASGAASSTLVGVDTTPRKGMYALRGQGCSIGVLSDMDDSTEWTTVDEFGLSEGLYMIQCGPSGDTITNAINTKAAAGLDSYASKLLFGDWVYWNDPVNGVLRLVSPQGFVAGRISNLSPEQSSLNKPLYGVVGTQKSGVPGTGQVTTYSQAELQALIGAGIDLIANPAPGGNYWAVRAGHNSSSDQTVKGDNYTRLTNYIASTLNNGMGLYVGQLINATLFNEVKATLSTFLMNLYGQGILGSLDGSLPFAVKCDTSNNPFSRTSLGYLQADVQVQYQGIVEFLIVNLQGGQTVSISKQTLPYGQVSS